MTHKQRLERLRITQEEFETFKRLFLSGRNRNRYAVQRVDGSWPQVPHPWNDSLILRHLCGENNVAIPFADAVNQIVLDIDYKGRRNWQEVEKTVRLATSTLPGEPLVYQSSESLGIRMIWFLNSTVSRTALCEWTEETLTKAGVTVQPGKCEVRLGSVPDRLPFGLCSLLLDSITLDPLYDLDLSETLQMADEHGVHYAVEPPTVRLSISVPKKERYRQVVTACLAVGLPPDVSTNDCLKALAWHGRVERGFTNDELRTFLKDWITHQNNGNSNRVNKGNIDSIYSQIDRIVGGIRAEPGGRRHAPNKPVGLTESELRYLLDLPGDFKTLGGLFRLLCLSKTRFFQESLPKKTTASPLLGRRIGTNKWGKVFGESEDIPNGAKNFHLAIDLPKLSLRRLRVPNANNPARWVREMERIGVLRKKREAWPDGHKARQYWVNFPFGAEGQPLSGSFDQVLWTVIGFDGIAKRFTRYQAKRIAKVVGFQIREKPVAVHKLAMKEVQSDSTART